MFLENSELSWPIKLQAEQESNRFREFAHWEAREKKNTIFSVRLTPTIGGENKHCVHILGGEKELDRGNTVN